MDAKKGPMTDEKKSLTRIISLGKPFRGEELGESFH